MSTKDDQLKADDLWKLIPENLGTLLNQTNYLKSILTQLKSNPYYQLEMGVDASATYSATDKEWIDNALTMLNGIVIPSKPFMAI